MPPKAIALTIDELYKRFFNTIITARDIRAATKVEEFHGCTSRNEQMYFLRQFFHENCYKSVSAKLLATIYDTSEGNVRKIICRQKKGRKTHGRPLSLVVENENLLVAQILSKRDTSEFMTIPEIIKYVEEAFKLTITRGWVNSFVFRYKDDLKKSVITAQDQLRLQVPRVYLEEYLDLIEVIIEATPAELVYNIDETGLSDWEEKKPKTVIVPARIPDDELHYPVNRGIRHITLVVTISAGGDAFFPLVVTSDPSLENVFQLGIRRDIDLSLTVAGSSYISKEIFKDLIINKFIPQVQNDRESSGLKDAPAILFYDNCSSHLDDEMLRILAENLIIVITYPPHTSHVFQVLDLLLFGILKKYKKYIPKDDTISPKIDHLKRVFHSYEMSTCSSTIRSSFAKAGFVYYQKDEMNYLHLNRSKIENTKEFKEIWDINYPLEELSTRRKNQPRGWINKQYFSKKFQKKVLNQ